MVLLTNQPTRNVCIELGLLSQVKLLKLFQGRFVAKAIREVYLYKRTIHLPKTLESQAPEKKSSCNAAGARHLDASTAQDLTCRHDQILLLFRKVVCTEYIDRYMYSLQHLASSLPSHL